MFPRTSSSGNITVTTRLRPSWRHSRNRVSGKPGAVQLCEVGLGEVPFREQEAEPVRLQNNLPRRPSFQADFETASLFLGLLTTGQLQRYLAGKGSQEHPFL